MVMHRWKSLATAPRTGRRFLILDTTGEVWVARCVNGFDAFEVPAPGDTFGWGFTIQTERIVGWRDINP